MVAAERRFKYFTSSLLPDLFLKKNLLQGSTRWWPHQSSSVAGGSACTVPSLLLLYLLTYMCRDQRAGGSSVVAHQWGVYVQSVLFLFIFIFIFVFRCRDQRAGGSIVLARQWDV